MEKKSSLSVILFGVAMLLFITATFAMFGATIVHYGSVLPFPTMFQAAFGSGADGYRYTGMTAIFVLQMIVLAGSIAIIVGTITNKFHYIFTIVLYCIVCLCSIIALIISFCTADIYWRAHQELLRFEYVLGPGPIAYSIMHIIGLVMSVGGLVLSRRGN